MGEHAASIDEKGGASQTALLGSASRPVSPGLGCRMRWPAAVSGSGRRGSRQPHYWPLAAGKRVTAGRSGSFTVTRSDHLTRRGGEMPDGRAHTFLFADISDYSLLTELHGDHAAADVAIHLMFVAARMAPDYGAEVVKGLGDGIMMRAEDAAQAIQLGLDLLARFGEGGMLPLIHVGIHTGPALRRAGDWWGATVNIASRVAGAAEPGQLLITEACRVAAGRIGSARFRPLEPRRLKNISLPVTLYAASVGLPRRPQREARGLHPSPRAQERSP
jgi:class 3 adenylate cyclase